MIEDYSNSTIVQLDQFPASYKDKHVRVEKSRNPEIREIRLFR